MKKLEAHEVPLSKVFSSDYEFAIPDYQRPYTWGIEQATQLLEDLYDAVERSPDEPYFLGSIVLVKEAIRLVLQRFLRSVRAVYMLPGVAPTT